jgi:hypothetical protein
MPSAATWAVRLIMANCFIFIWELTEKFHSAAVGFRPGD